MNRKIRTTVLVALLAIPCENVAALGCFAHKLKGALATLDMKSAIDITLVLERIGESGIILDGTNEIQTRYALRLPPTLPFRTLIWTKKVSLCCDALRCTFLTTTPVDPHPSLRTMIADIGSFDALQNLVGATYVDPFERESHKQEVRTTQCRSNT
jgi:hypothetical protein